RIANLLFATTDPATEKTKEQMRKIFEGLQKGQIDRSQFTSNANAYFNDQALKDFSSSLGTLGTPQEFTQSSQSLRGGMTLRRYRIRFPQKTLNLTTFILPDGKIEQYQIAAAE
ncbi:MAG TPA: serine hydrolase, partial [Thermoanaerobaculia bacterium]|nr:serine hydrolase [Thermoanaerobaculia bacterium]